MSGANPANLILNNATLNFLGNNTAGAFTTDSLGTVTLNSGASFIDSTSGLGNGAVANLTIGTLNRNPGTTVSFLPGSTGGLTQNLNTAFNKILINSFGAGAGLINGILPYGTVGSIGTTPNQYDFATVVAAGASNSIAAFTNYVNSLAAAGPTSTVRLTASETLTGNKVVNAILFAGTSAGALITITQSNFTLGVTSGAILSMGNNTLTISGGTVDFGTAEGILDQNNANITVTSALTGSNGLTVTATTAGTIALNSANNYQGTTTINGTGTGTVSLGNISALSNGAVNMTSGILANSIGINFAIGNQFNFNNSVVTFGTSTTNRTTFAGPITVTGNNFFSVTNPTVFGGIVSNGNGVGSVNVIAGNALTMQRQLWATPTPAARA